MGFSDLFGESAVSNQSLWRRDAGNPIVVPATEWSAEFVAPSSVLQRDGSLTVFVEGGDREREYVGAYTCDDPCRLGTEWRPDPGNPILRPAVGGFDRGSVFDPAAILFRGALRLYYSATPGGPHEFAEGAPAESDIPAEPECIGVAYHDGQGFARDAKPVLEGRCPAIIEWQEVLHLFYVKVVRGGYRIYLATSQDGEHFDEVPDGPVVDVGPAGAWDSYTVTTPKVFQDDDHFTMLYAGDDRSIDDPTGIGIAVSADLLHWSKHPGNPVFTTGDPGQFDSASVASAIPVRCHDAWQILYGGSDRTVVEGLHSQVGRAWLAL